MIVNNNLCKILDVLYVANQSLRVGDICKAIKISQPLCSQRLKVLKKYKLVFSRKRANAVYYKINDNYYELIESLININNVLAN